MAFITNTTYHRDGCGDPTAETSIDHLILLKQDLQTIFPSSCEMSSCGIKSDVEAHNKLEQIIREYSYNSEACAIVKTAYDKFVDYLLKTIENDCGLSENNDISFRRHIRLIGLLLCQQTQKETSVTVLCDWGRNASQLVFRCLYADAKDLNLNLGIQLCCKLKVIFN